jgi:hypothetical protein
MQVFPGCARRPELLTAMRPAARHLLDFLRAREIALICLSYAPFDFLDLPPFDFISFTGFLFRGRPLFTPPQTAPIPT